MIFLREQRVIYYLTIMATSNSGRKLKIAICHPDLGIGGAERLIVDAAVELASRGHEVHVFTAHHDHRRCFEETIDDFMPYVPMFDVSLLQFVWH